MTIFVGGKQKRVKRPIPLGGTDVDEFILNNADPVWLHQNEMWEYIESSLALVRPDGTAAKNSDLIPPKAERQFRDPLKIARLSFYMGKSANRKREIFQRGTCLMVNVMSVRNRI